jgi:hypothetical protein
MADYPFQQQIVEKIFGVTTYTTDWYMGLYLSTATMSTDTFDVFDSGITLVAMPTMEADASEIGMGYSAVSNAATFNYPIDADVTLGGWYIRNTNTAPDATRDDLAFWQSFSATYGVISGDILRWVVNTLVVEFWY